MTRNMNATAVNNNSWGPDDNGLPEASSSIWKMAVESGITEGYGGKGVFYAWAGGNGGSNDYSSLDEYAHFYGVTAVCAVNYERRAIKILGAGSQSLGMRSVIQRWILLLLLLLARHYHDCHL